jgi:two-component system sensor histidine kinase DegS
MSVPEEEKTSTAIEDPKLLIQNEFDETARALKEITLMLEQSRVELGKLTQRNASVTARLQQIHDQIGRIPPEEIRTVYDSALDAQQRLFVMRGQLEKLQSDQSHLERYKGMLERLMGSISTDGKPGSAKTSAVVTPDA